MAVRVLTSIFPDIPEIAKKECQLTARDATLEFLATASVDSYAFRFCKTVTMAEAFDLLLREIVDFRDRRNWGQFHTPRNLMLALTGEVGELASLMQWQSDSQILKEVSEPGHSFIEQASEEIADVLIYLILLSDSLGIDIETAVRQKLVLNEDHYPVAKSFGSAEKYTSFKPE